MGIRIHKAIGYGCRGFTPSPEIAARLREDEAPISALATWAEAHMTEILALPVEENNKGLSEHRMLQLSLSMWKEEVEDRYIHECFAWDPEFGVKDAILFIPPEWVQSWRRYDDTIDYHEETDRWAPEGQADYFRRLKVGLYPNRLGQVPLSVGVVMLYCGISPEIWPKLHEAIYVWWS